jgi:ComF family protein
MMRLDFNPVAGCCRVCSRAVEDFEGDYVCGDCRRLQHSFDRMVAAAVFDHEVRSLVLSFKYKAHLWLTNDFVDWLEASARSRFDVGSIDVIAPVPMLFKRKLLRGYNQCDILAEHLARRLGIRCDKKLLKRVGSPRRQSELGEAERRENVKGTFAAGRSSDISGRTVLLIDDVITTGSTLSECALMLKEAGARRVFCAALANVAR